MSARSLPKAPLATRIAWPARAGSWPDWKWRLYRFFVNRPLCRLVDR